MPYNERMEKLPKPTVTVPNILTLLRLILIPVIVFAIVSDRIQLAFWLFVVSSLTDFFDGYIARRFNQISEFGKVFDPTIDKLMIVTVLAVLAVAEFNDIAELLLVLALLQVLVFGLNSYHAIRFGSETISVTTFGKCVAASVMLFVSLLLINQAFMVDVGIEIVTLVCGALVFVTALLFVQYWYQLKK